MYYFLKMKYNISFLRKEMSNEVLVCLSFKDTFHVDKGYIQTGGKQYCWMEESDYLRLKEDSPCVTLGFDGVSDDYDTKLHVNKIENQSLINTILELGPHELSSCRIYFGPDRDYAGEKDLYVYSEEKIKYRPYPKWYEHPTPVEELGPLPDIVSKIMRM